MTFPERVSHTLRQGISPTKKLLVAVSGGPDSMALADALRQSAYSICIAHIDHQLRAGSARDARFVQQTARRWDLPCEVRRVNVAAYAKKKKIGIEEAARTLRYEALITIARKQRCTAVVTAHTANDQAETVLMNVLRGAGSTGLAGIAPVRSLAPGLLLVRPMLALSRQDVMTYLQSRRLAYRTDPTNKNIRMTRNRIRHQVLPLLEQGFPGLKNRLGQLAEILREEEAFWAQREAAEKPAIRRKTGGGFVVDLRRLLGYHKSLGRRILRRWLEGASFQDTERLYQLALSSNQTHSLHLTGGWVARRNGHTLTVIPSQGSTT